MMIDCFTAAELDAGEFFRSHTKDSKVRDVYVGLTYHESQFLKRHQEDFANRQRWTDDEREQLHEIRESRSTRAASRCS